VNRNQLQLLRLLIIVIIILIFIFYRLRPAMKKTVLAPQEINCGAPCGEERWAVKTLTDADASKVNFTAQPATVDWLVSQSAPSYLPANARIAPIETQTYTVRARLVGYKLEEDHDFHIVIADLDNSSETMIVEIPSPDCAGVCASPRVNDINSARNGFVSAFGMPIPRFHHAIGTVDVTGVAFFDFLHHQTGVAPNGIELHPVLNIQVE
jgi:hypothetical protein